MCGDGRGGSSLTPLSIIHLASSLKEQDHYSQPDRVRGGEEGPGPGKRDPAWQVKPLEARGEGVGAGAGRGGQSHGLASEVPEIGLVGV